MHSQAEIAIYFFMSLCHNGGGNFLWRCINDEEYQEILRSLGRDGCDVWGETEGEVQEIKRDSYGGFMISLTALNRRNFNF